METERIDLAEFGVAHYVGGWVEVKVTRPYAAARRIESAALVAVPKEGASLDELSSKSIDLHIDTLAQGLATLDWHVVAWSLTDEDGAPLPANRSGFLHDDFDAALGEWLTDRIDTLVAERRRSKSGVAEPQPEA